MKKINKLLIFLLLFIPIRVNALSGNISMECSPTTAKSNTNIVCNVTASSDDLINGIRADIKLSSNLEYVSFQTASNWQGDGTGNQIGVYSGENVEGTLNLGILTIKVKDNVFDSNETISLTNCLYSDANFEKVNIEGTSVNIRVPSSNNRLSTLAILPESINFNPDTLNYSVTVDSPTVNISAVKEDASSTLSGDIGDKNLNYGINTFKIHVTSESGDVRTYTINVTRRDNRSTENRLSGLTISGSKINFNENTYTYNLTVGYETTSIKINASLKDSASSYVKGYEPGTKTLKEGLNKIELKVTAENGGTKTYTINVTRQEDPENTSDDNYLDEIKTDTGKLDFSKEQEEYKMTVPYDINSINIDTTVSSNKSKVEVSGNENLQVGENTITIKVIAANGNVREYKIIVTKKEKEEILSNNNYLKSLKIDNYNISFNKEKVSYNLEISDEEKLNITALAEDENANVTITGNEKLKDGSSIKITITAEDGTTKTYTINIVKKLRINYLLITVILETTIIIGIITYFIIRRKRQNQYEEI